MFSQTNWMRDNSYKLPSTLEKYVISEKDINIDELEKLG